MIGGNAKSRPAEAGRLHGLTFPRRAVVWAARRLGYDVWRVPTRARGRQWQDAEFYRPFFSPWLGYGEFARDLEAASGLTVVSADRLYVLAVALRNALLLDGEVWECGVYKGGSARMLEAILRGRGDQRPLRLFDSFNGLPNPDPERDLLRAGAFGDTSAAAVGELVPTATIHAGWIPGSFESLENARIALAHIDLDLYGAIRDALAFIYPRLVAGAWLVFDDYGGQTTPGARAAVDEFFADRPEAPLVLASGQAIVIRST